MVLQFFISSRNTMTDAEILENYTREFVDVLKAYTGNDFSVKFYLVIGCPVEAFEIVSGKENLFNISAWGGDGSIFRKSVKVKSYNTGSIFYDTAPFEQKKEVSCED
jgi:hypothetical protein